MTTTMSTLAARIAETACVTETFTLADGQLLGSYFDEYRLAADPQLLRDVAAALVPLVPDDAEALAGIELGGVPLAVALSTATGLPAAFLRRLPKRYGSRRQIEGTGVEGRRVVLVDDVVRSGTQLAGMAHLLRTAGADVGHALCVLERPLGGWQRLREQQVHLRPLLQEPDLPKPREARS